MDQETTVSSTHSHMWSAWMPYDKKTKYRFCHEMACRKIEYMDVSGA